MLAIMFSKLKSYSKDFLGKAQAIQIVVKYDINIVYPFLLQVILCLNLVRTLIKLVLVEDDDSFFGQIVFNDDVIMFTLRNELQLFQWLHMGSTKIENALVCRSQHVVQFSHMCIFWLVEFFALLIYKLRLKEMLMWPESLQSMVIED